MVSEYVRERRAYSQRELYSLFKCKDEESAIRIIKKLKEFNILKTIKQNDKNREFEELQDEDFDVFDVEFGDDDRKYVFTFVGVIVVSGIVLKCYPKYILHKDNPLEELQCVLKVLEKYNSKNDIIRLFNDSNDDKSFNLLAVILFLLQDYFEYGAYTNTEDTIEVNGTGDILWDKTINETFTFISKSRPYYLELQTRKRVNDNMDYFKRLHECIITKVSNILKDSQLLDLFELTEAEVTEEELDDFGDNDYILYRIENELNTQFNTRKQLVLKTIYAYISQGGSLNEIDSLSIFGTISFNQVWEEICKDIMNNQLEKPLSNIKLPCQLKDGYDSSNTLRELIEKPLWTITEERAKNTLIPDIISIHNENQEYQFIIFDAKYYNARLEKGIIPKGQPGIESVTKQYLYQLAYKQFISDYNFSSVKNCFLLPTENSEIENKGCVRMDMLAQLELEDIQVRLIPATKAYDLYLSGRKMDIKELKL